MYFYYTPLVFPYSPLPQAKKMFYPVYTNLILYWMTMTLSPKRHVSTICLHVSASRFSSYPPNSIFCEGNNDDYSFLELKNMVSHRRVGPAVLLGNTLDRADPVVRVAGSQPTVRLLVQDSRPCPSLLCPLQQLGEGILHLAWVNQ